MSALHDGQSQRSSSPYRRVLSRLPVIVLILHTRYLQSLSPTRAILYHRSILHHRSITTRGHSATITSQAEHNHRVLRPLPMVRLPRPPLPLILVHMSVLTGHRAPRATWSQTELFLTFPTPLIRSITLQPLDAPETGGRFRVWLDMGNGDELVWDRKVSSVQFRSREKTS